MPMSLAAFRISGVAAAAVLSVVLSGCSGMSLVQNRTQGYEISQDALLQIRPGQSQDLVVYVLGSPQTTNSFGAETAWYYVQSKVNTTAFGLTTLQERTVLAIYFDKNKRVIDKAVYGAKDGRVITIEQRRTPSYGADKTFIESIISSI